MQRGLRAVADKHASNILNLKTCRPTPDPKYNIGASYTRIHKSLL